VGLPTCTTGPKDWAAGGQPARCGSVGTTSPTTIRCVQRTFDSLKKDNKNTYLSGEVTFVIIARENGVYSW
jgi:hypothetical protein